MEKIDSIIDITRNYKRTLTIRRNGEFWELTYHTDKLYYPHLTSESLVKILEMLKSLEEAKGNERNAERFEKAITHNYDDPAMMELHF